MNFILIRYLRFVNERFPVVSHLVMVVTFFLGTILMAGDYESLFNKELYKVIMSAVVIVFIFIHLRILDEIKDYKSDIEAHPDRPLPRGLISVKEAGILVFSIIVIELGLAFLVSINFFIALVMTIFYSLLMFKEFFIGNFLSKRIFLYALTHTPVTLFIIITIFAVYNGNIFSINRLYLSISGILQAFVFEISRKTFIKEMEKKGLASYSGMAGFGFSIIVCVILLLSAVTAGVFFGINMGYSRIFIGVNAGYGLIFTILAIRYFIVRNKTSMKLYQLAGALYIMIFNICGIAESLWIK